MGLKPGAAGVRLSPLLSSSEVIAFQKGIIRRTKLRLCLPDCVLDVSRQADLESVLKWHTAWEAANWSAAGVNILFRLDDRHQSLD